MNPRQPPIRSRKMLEAANGEACAHCGRRDGTVVAAHYQGLGSARLGKGKAQKPHDFAVADLCSRCHDWFDQYGDGNDLDHAFDFLMAIMVTLERRWRAGVIGDGK